MIRTSTKLSNEYNVSVLDCGRIAPSIAREDARQPRVRHVRLAFDALELDSSSLAPAARSRIVMLRTLHTT